MKEFTCMFTGHRQLQKKELPLLAQRLSEEIQKQIESGVTRFVLGGALGFDLLAATEVLKCKKENSKINLTFILPCKDQHKFWSEKQKEAVFSLLCQADTITVLSENYYNGCMKARNVYMVNLATSCICYYTKEKTGTSQTVSLCKKKGLSVVNIADEISSSLNSYE